MPFKAKSNTSIIIDFAYVSLPIRHVTDVKNIWRLKITIGVMMTNKTYHKKSASQIVSELWEQQEDKIAAMAMTPHEQTCPQTDCTGCFKVEPDKIVQYYYEDTKKWFKPSNCPCADCE